MSQYITRMSTIMDVLVLSIKHNAFHSGKIRARASSFSNAVTCYVTLLFKPAKIHFGSGQTL